MPADWFEPITDVSVLAQRGSREQAVLDADTSSLLHALG